MNELDAVSQSAPPDETLGEAAAFAGAQGPSSPPPSRVLLAIHGGCSPKQALRFADRLVRSLGAELHVLRVVPRVESSPVAGDFIAIATREAQRVLAAARRTRAFCDAVLSESLPSPRVCVRLGSFVEQVALRAAELNVALIAVPKSGLPLAATVIRLARKANRPVVVARGKANFSRLLAATDLEDSQVPLLRKAAQLGRALEVTAVAVHGVLEAPEGRNGQARSLEESLSALERVTRCFEATLEGVVVRSRSRDPVSCIIEQARAHDAGLIVVGVRPRLDRAHPTTAAKLLKAAHHPVVVVPLGTLQP